ncbi:dipeptidyl aminopeptidase/acylaminoacyl peptidase [Nakamurella sp. UYEF19]|uniref:prolyl oligopeptidase family serine peptidase n=1 Tax=Nakamurella sp. UYEF19 TaxID=1756392 RepID=UPI00339B1639
MTGTTEHGTTPGSWPSPISADQAVTAGRSLEAVAFAGDRLWWSEGRPSERGRVAVCTTDAGGATVDLLPAPWDARTRVHEYGGTSWLPVPAPDVPGRVVPGANGHDLVFAHFTDQRLYRLTPAGEPVPLTPAPTLPAGLRYADMHLDTRRSRLLAVRETHRGDSTFGTVDRTIVAIPLDGNAAEDPDAVIDLLAGQPRTDFLASPRLSPAGDALVWISWNHPDMPWDSTIAHLAALDRSGAVAGAVQQIAGGAGISVVDPGFAPDGSVLLISDESGWWRPILIDPRTGARRYPTALDTDFAPPLWVLGRRNWAAVPGGRLLLRPGGRPSVLDTFSGELRPLDPEWTSVGDLTTDGSGRIALVVGSDTAASEVVLIQADGSRQSIRSGVEQPLPNGFAPVPQTRTFDGVHAVVYPPTHPDHRAAAGTAPMVITVHGGPTAAHSRSLSTITAYFTSRGFVVAAVDYRGSTGYGRPYREALTGRWAELDVADAMTVASGLLADGTAGAAFISGGSAGGLTVLGALTTEGNPFSAGVSSYGVGDLAALMESTHDFESRYLHKLTGTGPDVLVDRSPLHHADRLARPVLLLQGGKDPIVTPDQAESFAAACAARGIAHALIVFPEEGHGFRAAAARKTALEAELAFYGQVLGFPTPGVPSIELISGETE